MKRGRLLWGFGGGQTEKAPPFLKGTAEPERILDLGRRGRSFDAAFLEGGFLYHHGLSLIHIWENTFCTWFDALSVLIPAGYGLRGLTGWSLVRGAPVPEDLSLTEQQVLSVLRPRRKPLPAADLAETLGPVSYTHLHRLPARPPRTAHG